MKNSLVIIKKELYRVFGDKKMIFSLFLLPAFLMVAIFGIMGVMIDSMSSDIEEHKPGIIMVGSCASLDGAIKASGFDTMADITYISEDSYNSDKKSYADDVLGGGIDLIVYPDKDFDELIGNYQKAGDRIPSLKLIYNDTISYSSSAYSMFTAIVGEAHKTGLLAERIGNLEMLNIYNDDIQLIHNEQKANTEFLSMMLPYLIVMMLFAGVMSVGVDAIAGEKERGTLASMLLTPMSRTEIVFGKLVSMSIISGLSSLMYALSMIISLPLMAKSFESMGESGFSSLSFSARQIIQLVLIMLILVYLFVSIVALLAAFAKDTKNAATYVSPVYIVVIVMGMMTMFTSGTDIPLYRYIIPVYGDALAIKDICANELSAMNFLATIGGDIVVSALITSFIGKVFNSEKYMFNA